MKQIFYFIEDMGDGSAIVRWYEDYEAAEKYIEENIDYCSMNEGGPDSITLPEDFDISTLGVDFRD